MALNGQLQFSIKLLKDLLKDYGLSGRNIIKSIHKEIYGLDISAKVKIKISKVLAECEFRLSQGASEEIQLLALLSKIVLLQEIE
jgi:replication factor C small subunit